MANRLKFVVDWYNKALIKGVNNRGTATLPVFFLGDVVPIQVTIVEPNDEAPPNGTRIIDISSVALKLAVSGTLGGTALVTQYTWSKNTDEQYLYAEAGFNTAALDTFMDADSKTAWLELELTEGTAVTTIVQKQITIYKEVVTSTLDALPAGQTQLSLEVAIQMFPKKFMDPGETITFVSEDSNSRRITGVRNDKTAQDDVI